MEQFNLEEYIANPERKIVTRDGRDVRIICTDRVNAAQPIVALVKHKDAQTEYPNTYHTNGRLFDNNDIDSDADGDLFFAPVKHEGWVNIYCAHSMSCGLIYQSEERAKQEIDRVRRYITTTKIEWEE